MKQAPLRSSMASEAYHEARALIGAALADPVGWLEEAFDLRPEDFPDPQLAQIHGVLRELHLTGRPVELAAAAALLQERGEDPDGSRGADFGNRIEIGKLARAVRAGEEIIRHQALTGTEG